MNVGQFAQTVGSAFKASAHFAVNNRVTKLLWKTAPSLPTLMVVAPFVVGVLAPAPSEHSNKTAKSDRAKIDLSGFHITQPTAKVVVHPKPFPVPTAKPLKL